MSEKTSHIWLAITLTRLNEFLHFWEKYYQIKCGPMPTVMAALPNIGGALCSTPQSLDYAHYLSAVQ